jgi:chemotaxis protein MotB
MSMQFTFRLFAIFMVATLALSSCVSKKKFDELQAEKDGLANTLSQSQQKVTQLEQKVASLEADMASEKTRMNGELDKIRMDLASAKSDLNSAKAQVQAKEAELASVKQQVKDAFGLGSDVAVSDVDGHLYVTLANPVNYKSGSAKLNKDAKKAVEALANTMKNNPGLSLLIEGHADTDKYPRGAAMDNWQLSVNRAMAVVKHLIKSGVKPEQLTVAGRGDIAPVAPNDKDGKPKNRRTEAKPTVKTGTLYKIGG